MPTTTTHEELVALFEECYEVDETYGCNRPTDLDWIHTAIPAEEFSGSYTFLDVGCGRAQLLEDLVDKGVAGAEGLELIPRLCPEWPEGEGQIVPQPIRFTLASCAGDLRELPYEDKQFGFVCAFRLLESILPCDTLKAIDELWRVTSFCLLGSIDLRSRIPVGPGIETCVNLRSLVDWQAMLRAATMGTGVYGDEQVDVERLPVGGRSQELFFRIYRAD